MTKKLMFCCACAGAPAKAKSATDAVTDKLLALIISLSLILFQFSHAWPAIQKQQKVTEIPWVKRN
ncbi:MAG TPA: hypothetical protein VN930_06510 [Xanthobacteraceae bacterium]|nr:hypothetical protein [Xanthobacteraceae bacterium]